MADAKAVRALLQKLIDSDPESVMVFFKVKDTNITTMEMAGVTQGDILGLSSYARYRLDRLVTSYFNQQAPGHRPAPPLMAAPQRSDLQIAEVPSNKPPNRKVSSAVAAAIRPKKKKR